MTRSAFKVAQGGSVVAPAPSTTVFGAGDILPDDMFTTEQIEAHIKSGYIIAVNRSEAVPEPERLVENPPGQDKPLTVRTDNSTDQRRATPSSVEVHTNEGINTSVAPTTKPPSSVPATIPAHMPVKDQTIEPVPDKSEGDAGSVAPSPWTLDPTQLEGLDVHDLNVMIQERDPRMPTVPTVEQAGAILTRDFKPAETEVATS